ncbi:MAG TPA: AMP-binding protein [Pirellulales bacterium]|jgi:phenylacetate-CoA ligase|nr:AMP-binding protein [Pirellulales bacterium]
MPTSHEQRQRLASLDPEALDAEQLRRLNDLLARLLPANRFYAEKLADVELPLRSLDELAALPYTFKEELLGPGGTSVLPANLTFARDRYVRFHQTSGTHGRPLAVLDTADDWAWWIDCWQYVLDAAEITADDTVAMAFSFGPFVGFWSAFDAAAARGCLMIPLGGMNTLVRLELIRSSQATVVFCTPSYALHMAEVAAERKIDVAEWNVRKLVLSGEPGGSVAAIRERIEAAWGAKVVDHGGGSEVGPWGYTDRARRGLHVLESEFLAEFLSVETGQPAGEGELAELVLTNLGRVGCPVIRYRTGDLVRPMWQHDEPCRFVLLPGGILGRSDDMLIIRGVNIYPSAIEQILRSFPEVLEYRMIASRAGEMDQLTIEVEDRLDQPQRIAEELQIRLGLKVDVICVPLTSLPRFDGKGRRFVDRRGALNVET